MGARRHGVAWWVVVALALVGPAGCLERGDDATDDGAAGDMGEVDTAATTVVPLEIVTAADATLALVPVEVAGQGPFPFALDTGASRSVIDDDIVGRLDLPPAGSTEVSGVTGVTRAETVTVSDWSIGDVALDERVLAAVPFPEPEGGRGVEGLLGSDVLSTFGQITVDYDAGELHLAPR